MTSPQKIASWKDKILFTPGPLTTSPTVKQAMLRDLGSRDFEFIGMVKEIRRRLVEIAGASTRDYAAIPMQGSGTFGLESALGSVTPPHGKLLVASNGAYGRRLAEMARALKIPLAEVTAPEDERIDPSSIAAALLADAAITTVFVVHCETSTGIFNPIEAIGPVVRRAGRTFLVDAMSSFGGVSLNIEKAEIDYLVSSSNKCIEGVPGFSFIFARRAHLESTAGWARSFSMDLRAQLTGLEGNGQFRFTPPTHSLVAFHQALVELEREGGVAAREERYLSNYRTLVAGMRKLGFREFLKAENQGHIITSFHYPKDSKFRFDDFYERLNARGYVIYPGKLSNAECFRIGNIGRIFPTDVEDLVGAIARVLDEMGLAQPLAN